MTPTPRLNPNTWLRRITDRWELVYVTTVMSSGTVLLQLLDGTTTTTTVSYLRGTFEAAEGSTT
jgi:hypothetical protein